MRILGRDEGVRDPDGDRSGRAIRMRDGLPAGVVVPVEDAELLEREDEEDARAVAEALREGGPNVHWETLKSESGL